MANQQIEVTINYLEQNKRPALPRATTPPGRYAILRAESPPIHFYRYLYEQIGNPYNWISRKRMCDADLLKILIDPNNYVYVLYAGGTPAGLAEIDARNSKCVELKFFGLIPEFIGKGLSRYFLTQAIELAWQLTPERVILETCSLDHPAALSLYQKLGFSIFDQKNGHVEVLD